MFYSIKNKEKEKFIFAVTIQNHGGYNSSRFNNDEMVQLGSELNTYTDAREYLTLIQKADQALESLFTYFEKIDDNYCVCKKIKSMVTFRKHDLITEKYEGGFDLIVCRNVVIYFKSDAKMEVYGKLSDALNKGGFLFVGGTESIYDYNKVGLERVSTFIYKKL